MADEKKPETFPSPVEPDDGGEDEEPRSSLSEEEAARRAEREIEEIEHEVDPEADRPSKTQRALPRHEGPQKSFVDRAWDKQYQVEARFKRIGHGKYSRVLRMARKPEHEEFVRASQITAIGIAVIGTVGFLIFLLTSWIWGLLGIR